MSKFDPACTFVSQYSLEHLHKIQGHAPDVSNWGENWRKISLEHDLIDATRRAYEIVKREAAQYLANTIRDRLNSACDTEAVAAEIIEYALNPGESWSRREYPSGVFGDIVSGAIPAQYSVTGQSEEILIVIERADRAATSAQHSNGLRLYANEIRRVWEYAARCAIACPEFRALIDREDGNFIPTPCDNLTDHDQDGLELADWFNRRAHSQACTAYNAVTVAAPDNNTLLLVLDQIRSHLSDIGGLWSPLNEHARDDEPKYRFDAESWEDFRPHSPREVL